GCNACIVACSIENNVQVVGKKYVGQGREMQWLRLDRYFLSEDIEEAPADPQMVMQPVLCMHCENAPCESVCPVAATVHSPDGTNQMIYNRCIGTRYCSNNCPYKVRRYNFFNWSKTIPVEVQMMQNPNVTVRFRGVMEKCSFCVQRIRRTQQRAQLEDRNVQDGEVVTACQQACASDALVFGDLNDPESAVSKMRENSRRYEMLAELDVKPRVSYLGRVRNPHPSLVQESAMPEEPEA
ncbi:MAG TPA: 4Fe-4S dicluster domain-containing protein, partial [Rhodothermales bacterium]|nr:4Fe-4S dicluster domain-containing protein [Rhodothermales bacterium]